MTYIQRVLGAAYHQRTVRSTGWNSDSSATSSQLPRNRISVVDLTRSGSQFLTGTRKALASATRAFDRARKGGGELPVRLGYRPISCGSRVCKPSCRAAIMQLVTRACQASRSQCSSTSTRHVELTEPLRHCLRPSELSVCDQDQRRGYWGQRSSTTWADWVGQCSSRQSAAWSRSRRPWSRPVRPPVPLWGWALLHRADDARPVVARVTQLLTDLASTYGWLRPPDEPHWPLTNGENVDPNPTGRGPNQPD
jgi:hypothetical protein